MSKIGEVERRGMPERQVEVENGNDRHSIAEERVRELS